MPKEIERKFLVTGEAWRDAPGKIYKQGYLSSDPARIVRVRRAGEKAYLTVKGLTEGVTRAEYEYEVPPEEAEEMLKLCAGAIIEKTRHVVEYGGKKWEVDDFHGDNEGLVVAEIELRSEDEEFERPPWVGREVSDDPRYSNASLSERPYKEWK